MSDDSIESSDGRAAVKTALNVEALNVEMEALVLAARGRGE